MPKPVTLSEAIEKKIRKRQPASQRSQLSLKKPASAKVTAKSQFDINLEIEALLTEKGTNPAEYSSEEKILLANYEGYGGIGTNEMTMAQAKGSKTEFYTPDAIVQKMWGLAYKHGYTREGAVLDPSCGTGRFLKYVSTGTPFTAFEISPFSYQISKILYPAGNIFNNNFETLFIKNNNTVRDKYTGPKFDLVITNPPYDEAKSMYMGMGELRYTGASDWINYFITRGLDTLNPGGLLVYIIGTEVMNGGTPWLGQSDQTDKKVKEAIAAKADLIDAYRLPIGVFTRTDVLSDIIVLRKK